eukprot:224367-Amphidinium_carterae.1
MDVLHPLIARRGDLTFKDLSCRLGGALFTKQVSQSFTGLKCDAYFHYCAAGSTSQPPFIRLFALVPNPCSGLAPAMIG